MAELPFDLECELQAIAVVFKDAEWQFDKHAYDIIGRQIDGATARLAFLIGKSVDWVEDRAKAYRLRMDLDSEFGRTSEAVRNLLPESYFVAVARKYSDEPDENHVDLGEAMEKLTAYTSPKPTGEAWTLETIRADLPHVEKDFDYLDAARKLIPQIVKRLIKAPALGIPETVYKIAAAHFQAGVDALAPYMEKQ